MWIDTYTRNGKIIEMHLLKDYEEEIYILFDQKEPRILRIEKEGFEYLPLEDKYICMIEEGKEKFRKTRLQNIFEECPNPPLLTFLENMITKKDFEILKQKIKEKFLHTETNFREISMFIYGNCNLEFWHEFSKTNNINYEEIIFYTACYNTFISGNLRKFLYTKKEPIGTIGFHILTKTQNDPDTDTIIIKDIV